MVSNIILSIFVLCLPCYVFAQVQHHADLKSLRFELNTTYHKAYAQAQALDKLYLKRGLISMKQANLLTNGLIAAQGAWQRYQKLECDNVYNHYLGGSIRDTMAQYCLRSTTQHRIEVLNAIYLKNILSQPAGSVSQTPY